LEEQSLEEVGLQLGILGVGIHQILVEVLSIRSAYILNTDLNRSYLLYQILEPQGSLQKQAAVHHQYQQQDPMKH